MLSCLVVQPFLLAMSADIHLAIKAKNNCYSLLGFYCSARFKRSVYYSCKIFSSLPLFGDNRGLGFVLCYAINKLETLLRGAIKSAQPLPPSLLAALLLNIACKPIPLSDPARAVLRSARSAEEISEVLWSRHCRKSHGLT